MMIETIDEIRLENEVRDFMVDKTETDLLEVLHVVQNNFGYIPRKMVTIISKTLDIPVSRIYGVITFYSRFSLVPKGKYAISVCMGTACYVKNAEKILDEFSKQLGIEIGETTEDLIFSLVETRCVGDCAAAPVVTVNDTLYKHVKIEDVKGILANLKEVSNGDN